MKKRIKISQEMIVEAINGFDFEKVRKAMVALDWKWWHDGGMSVPEILEMKRVVFELISHIQNRFNITEARTGGFSVRYDKHSSELSISFVVTSLFIDTDLNIY